MFQREDGSCCDCERDCLEQGTFHTKIKKEKSVEFLIKEKLITWNGKLARLQIVADNGEKA